MPGAVRIPVRPLTIDQQDLYAYPGEILIDPATGLIKYLVDDSSFVFNKNPGTLTVKYGTQTILDGGDMSTALSFTIPAVTWEDIAPDNISASLINGLTANRVLVSNAYGILTASAITSTELSYLDNLTGNIQTQLDGKAALTHNHDDDYLGIDATAAAAIKLATARNITIGDATRSFDGSTGISFTLSQIGAAAASHNHDGVYLPIGGTATAATKLATAVSITIGSASYNFNGTSNLTYTLDAIGAAAASHNHNGVYLPIGGTAAAATKLATSRAITIGNASRSFDGSAPISFTLSDIGAAAANHSHSYSSIELNSDGSLSGYGGFIDFHHSRNPNTDYTSRIIENTAGTLDINGVRCITGGNLNVPGNATGIQNIYSGTLSTTWSGSSAPYTQVVTVSGILSTDRPIVDFTCSGNYATDQSREEGWLNIYRVVTAANRITFYAHEKPTVSIPFTALVTR